MGVRAEDEGWEVRGGAGLLCICVSSFLCLQILFR